MRISLIGAVCALSACAGMDQAKLNDWSPLEADPALMRAAVDLPDGVAVPADGAVLTFGAVRQDTGEVTEQDYTLLRAETAEGLSVFRLSEEDVVAYRALQRQIGAWKAVAPEDTDGTLAINVAACRVGDGPDPDATLTVLVDPGTGTGWVPVVRDAPIQAIIEKTLSSSDAC